MITREGFGISCTSLGGGRVLGFDHAFLIDDLLSNFFAGLRVDFLVAAITDVSFWVVRKSSDELS